MIFDIIAICIFLLVLTLPITGFLVARWGQKEAGQHPWDDRNYKN
jgi:hypothetical protein